MKKNVIALAIAAAVAAPAANAAPTVYGQVNMNAEIYDTKDAAGDKDKANSGAQVNSRASRLGVKGSEDLGSGLKAVYKFEFEVQPDKGDTLKNRNQFVGLAGGFGTVLMGRHDTPYKMSQPKDFFNDAPLSDFGKMADGLGAFKKGGENRVSNVLAYVSPSFAGIKLVGALVPKETGGDAAKESSFSDLMSFAAMYGSKKKGLYLGLGYDTASKNYTGGEAASHLRLSAQYAVAGLIVNGMYQDFGGKALEDTTQEGTTMSVGAGYKIGKFMPKLQVMAIDRKWDDAEDATNYALGVDYKLGKKTTTWVEYAMIDKKGGAKDTDAQKSAFSIGLKHKF